MYYLAAQLKGFWTRALATSYFGSQVILSSAGSLIGGVLGLLSGPLIARMLGPHGRGELAAIQVWAQLLMTIASLGLHEATIYFSARHPEKASQYVSSAIVMTGLAGLPIMLAGYLAMPLLLAAQSQEVVTAAQWYLFFIPLLTLYVMPLGAMRGRADLVPWNVLRLLMPLGWLVVIVLAGLAQQATPHWIAGAYLAMMAVLCVIVWSVARVRVPGSLWPDLRDWRPMLHYGLPTMAAQVPMLLNLRVDQMLMAALLAPHDLGFYAVAVAWSSAISPVIAGFGVVMFPLIAAQTNASDQLATLARGTRLGVLSAAIVGLGLLVITPVAIPTLFGASFSTSITTALILVVAGVVAELNGILREGVRGLGMPKIVLGADIVGFASGALILALLLSRLGIVGAAVASLVGYIATAAFLILAIQHTTHCSVITLLWPKPELDALWKRVIRLGTS